MFRKKKKLTCPYCGREVQPEWNYCPYCGHPLKQVSPFGKFEEAIEKEFERFDKLFGFKLPRIKFGPSGGISITITSGTDIQPKVKVKTYGDYRKHEPKQKLGVGVKEVPIVNPPKVTEEPKSRVKHLGLKDVIEINLPDVKSAKDIQIRELEQSIEVKARAGDKLYFKLLPVLPGRILHKKFSKGKLVIEIER